MAERDTGELFLAGSLDDDDSDGDSDYESNGSARSGYSDGGSIFGELSACREHHQSIQRRSTARHGDETDDDAHTRVGVSVDDVAISTIDTIENRAVRALRSRGAERSPNRPSSETVSPNPSEMRGEGFLGTELVKNVADAPPEQQRRRF